ALGQLLARLDDNLAGLVLEVLDRFETGDAGADGEHEPAVANRDGLERVEGAEQLRVRVLALLDRVLELRIGADLFEVELLDEPHRAQKDRRKELTLPVDAHVEKVLGVVLELDPRAAVRNDLGEKVGVVIGLLEEDARASVELADDDALGAVDDEGTVVG